MLAPSHRKFISPEINLENSCKFYKVRVEANNCIDPYRYLAPALSRQHLSPSVWSVRTQQSPLQAAKGQSTPVRGAGWAEICSPTQGTGRKQCRLTKQTLQEASKRTDEKMTFARGKQDVCGCPLSLHLSMSPCNVSPPSEQLHTTGDYTGNARLTKAQEWGCADLLSSVSVLAPCKFTK